MEKISISRIGKLVDLSPKTIRYYEEIGLIKPAIRGDNGYRLFNPAQMEELGLIKKARDLGLSINEIRKLLNGCVGDSCHHDREDILSEIDLLIDRINEKIFQFTYLKQRLSSLKKTTARCSKNQRESLCCNLLYQLVNGKGGDNNVQVL